MKVKSFAFCLLFMICTGIQAQQRIILTSTSSKYPYERSQWTKAQGEAWVKKFGPIKGINHPMEAYPGMSRKECLKKVKELGFNSVRMFIGGSTADAFINNTKSWAADCAAEGLTLAPVFGFSDSYYNQSNKKQALTNLEKYVRKVAQAFRGDDRVILWDVWNEPKMDDATATPEIMDWIKQMAKWMRQEGCTQAITSSIVWDAGNSAASNTSSLMQIRNQAEAEMDLHNFHDYGVSEDFGSNVSVMTNRLKKINDVPLVCTECLTRTNGSGVARTLTEFAKYHINFYTWGLYTSDANWEVKWYRSTFYAWEPMFHNLLYADGDPYDESELPWIANFKFINENESIDPGTEYTERWSPRRAWKWMSRQPVRGLYYPSVDEAIAGVAAHTSDGLYNSISVDLDYSVYRSNSSSFYTKFNKLLSAADAAGMTVLPTLMKGDDVNVVVGTQKSYVYSVMGKYYHDARILGWNVYQQTADANEDYIKTRIPEVIRYTRYNFPNQPIFMTPLINESITPNEEANDLANLLWNISDVISFVTADGSPMSQDWIDKLKKAYFRPLLNQEVAGIGNNFALNHINWFATTEPASTEVKNFNFDSYTSIMEGQEGRWTGWKTWAYMNRGETKGLYYGSMEKALAGVDAHKEDGLYNSVRVLVDYGTYSTDTITFFHDLDSLIDMAGKAGMTVVPALITDKYAAQENALLTNYVQKVIERYKDDARILAWDLYYRPGATYSDASKIQGLIEPLFQSARAANALQPIFATVSISAKDHGENDYIEALEHYNEHAGWLNLQYTRSSSAKLCYTIWCLSDVIAYSTTQKYIETGMTNSVAYRFGRPIFCTQWKTTSTEEPSQMLSLFSNMHVNWFVDGNISDDLVSTFKFEPVTTEH